jgi:3-oxoacyl-[acyl-carrier protein] reductase
LFAKAGANVVIGYRDSRSSAGQLAEELIAMGGRAVAVPGDVAERAGVEAVFERGRTEFGKIDIVVGNAGIWKEAPIEEMSEVEWDQMVDVNLKSAYLICQLAVREMKPRRAGKIILVSSTAGQRGESLHSHYAATKGGVIALTKSLASELGPHGIRVNAVAPGWVDTDMSADQLGDPEQRKVIEETIPLGYVPSAEEIAGPILFLASSLADHVHGEILNVNGGSVLCG